MAPKWTDQQLKAIQPADRLTVLSAAAGSGKTTVLVARALNLLLDEENPVSAEKMLIVTFSNASAAEFKKRIEKGINEKIKENPTNNYIKMQKVALQKADIEWKKDIHIPFIPKSLQKTGNIINAPNTSNNRVPLITKLVNLTIPPTCGADKASCIIFLCEKESFRPDNKAKKDATVITPIPPICIKQRITNCPKYDQ